VRKNILVIGGTRFFGRLLVARLIEAGHQVTLATRGRTADLFGTRVGRIGVDRRDAAAMTSAFAAVEGYDLVFDQVCYSPLDAAISARVFGGRVKRYVMASTLEVYSHLHGHLERPFVERDVDLSSEPIELAFPWHTPAVAEARYGEGKRQAEAYFHQDGRLPVVSVRIAHVLAGPEDFTERLANYVARVTRGEPLKHSSKGATSSFIDAAGISDFLCWVGDSTFVGPINAASHGPLSALDLHQRVARVLGRPALVEPVAARVKPSTLSPFDYPSPYAIDTGRARSLGYRFGHHDHWLDKVIGQHVLPHGSGLPREG